MNQTNKRMNEAIRRAAGKVAQAEAQPAPTGYGSADGGAGQNQQQRKSTVNTVMNQAIRDARHGGA